MSKLEAQLTEAQAAVNRAIDRLASLDCYGSVTLQDLLLESLPAPANPDLDE